jgi:hypothetical protein
MLLALVSSISEGAARLPPACPARVKKEESMAQRNHAERWLLVIVSTAAASSTLRVHAWRKLRSLGGLYLQQSVCLLPERSETNRAVKRLLDRVWREGGEGRALTISITDPREERAVIEEFQWERADEYGEVVSRTPAFLEEIEMERARGRATYAEVEESEADLDRLRAWLSKIRARDYFGSPAAEEAEAAVERCAAALAKFEAEALAGEAPEQAAPARQAKRSRPLRTVEGG